MPDISRRTVARSVAWAVPTIAVAAAAPAYAVSPGNRVATIGGGAPAYYGWGANTTNPRTTATTTQKLEFAGQVSLSDLPRDAVITGISYTYWFQNRVDTDTNPNGASGAHGPGIYVPGNARASTYSPGVCTVSGSTVNGCRFTYGSAAMSAPTDGNTNTRTNPFTSGSASGAVRTNLTQHTFDNGRTTLAWQFVFTGDPAKANALLTTDAEGYKHLALQSTPQMNVTYTNVLQNHPAQRTIQVDRFSTVTYTSGGRTHTLTRRIGNSVFCNSSAQPGGVNMC
ncbi:hypothetical protein [Kocuria palustris]|uniref:hypothetical protein n=1 Tax=Kocuria palustris TaxID=71999 RepID=UPI0011A95502|nr:hypothetical protein [Kocuria palustris]